MRRLTSIFIVALAATGLLAGASRATDFDYAKLEKGRALMDAGDCVACHTQDKSKPFAGGRAIPTPFGTIYSANITPDRDTGIGAWTADDFYRALHEGIAPHGERLYPAFPYPYFTRMSRDDVEAVRAYLMSLDPVSNTPPANELIWPLNIRSFMAGWNMLFFTKGEFQPDPHKSAEWNRGAYLVEGPGHCGACHTPKNMFGADKSSEALRGGVIQDWTAPNLTAQASEGLGRWSEGDIVEYLKTGRNRLSGATGLMAEVVVNSTSKMSDADLKAIAIYLKDVGASPAPSASVASQNVTQVGEAIYKDSCAACHQADGKGVPHMFPPLQGNAVAQQADATTVLRVILEGAKTAATAKRPTTSAMPAYGWKIDDRQIAAVATYIRNSWDNKAGAVGSDAVASVRDAINARKAAPQTVGTGARVDAEQSR
jgi:mono/diheme cytochrome c family protein